MDSDSSMTSDERAYLELYTPRTHGVELPRDLAKSMEAKGWVEWVPPMFGSSRLYSITEAGKKALESDTVK
jgi:hypothetical protein